MKIIKLLIVAVLLIPFALVAQSGFTVQQAEGDFEMGAFKEMKGVQVLEIKDKRAQSAAKLPDSELVYQVVKAHASSELTREWDQLDYDRFYIRLHSIKAQDLIKIYQGLTLEQVKALKADFKKYE